MENKSSKSAVNFGELKNNKILNILYEKGILYFFLSFIIPFVIMLIAFHKEDIHMLWFTDGKLQESGAQQFLVVDLWHQYFPFFRVLREKLLTGGSFLYSWDNGIGTNFIALIAYYAASPLNWMSIFFDEAHAREALMYFLAAKIGFCGAFFSCFLRYTFGRKDLSIVGFSLMYALCSYMLGYYWNVMWFDTIAIFPLVMLGVVAMCREKKWKLYTIALALSLITNYYIGFFTCIFTIFMFAASAIIEWQGFKAFFNRLWLIFRSSVIGIALGGFILLPAYKALQLTYGVNNEFPKEVVWENKWPDLFANLLSYSPPTSKEGLPNFACGMLAIALIGVFLFAAGIKIREKISAVLLLALIAVSCNMNQLNFIWHGFHVTNQLPYRYSFIFSFVLVVMAYRAYDIMTKKDIKLYQLLLLVIGPGAIVYMCYLSAKAADKTFDINDAELKSSLIIAGAYVLIFICMKFIPIKDKAMHRAVLNIMVTIAIVMEMSANSVIGVDTVGSSDYGSYPSYNGDVQNVIEKMENRENPLFYRAEMTSTYTLNDSALYGYRGISQFSSSANVSITRFLRNLGMYGSDAGNRYYYRTATPVVNSILGMKYVISKLGPMNSCSAFLEPVESSNSVNLYENKYPLSLGFMMNREVTKIDAKDYKNPFEFQNAIMKKASGLGLDLFTAQPVTMASHNNVDTLKDSYGEYRYNITDKEKSANSDFSFAGVDGGYLYGYFEGRGVKTIDVKNNAENVETGISSSGYSIAFPMGDIQSDGTATATLYYEDDATSGYFTFVGYAVNEEVFTQMHGRLADEQLEITEFSDTKIKGNINAEKSGVLYFSIPYEKGWSVYIDGVKADTFALFDAMLGVEAPAGQHEIELKYTPEGFVVGVIASGGALLLFIVFVFVDKKKKNKITAEPVKLSADNGKMEDLGNTKAVNDLGFAANIPLEADMTEASELAEEIEPAEAEKSEGMEDTEEKDEKSESPDSVQGD